MVDLDGMSALQSSSLCFPISPCWTPGRPNKQASSFVPYMTFACCLAESGVRSSCSGLYSVAVLWQDHSYFVDRMKSLRVVPVDTTLV